ncbi:MAG: tRNA preQ1(34) S-adenosylmethionine ribosyltransferase-isomerase QueA [Planctomycetia bacterium]|nr:tRNA preQ1(34) S-adenosylmethionine ribosyltransferase-isomerase QueA [Planctomycetia bacterium]MCC7315792.1 tRNA preQ1(34) S-adenosylmethionine ribosyltransferase-isomerase QueA [Planctomycetota bacterium]OQZ06133.1 MAG: tRNA preQ1(34) S-adenosylmethionine ribosyltransferase-isomerase QueA [Planctomycetes bacterium UTPLA1]
MKTSQLHYELPAELIAQTPLERRDQARMLVLDRASGRISHRHFSDLPEYLRAGDCLVLNRSKVVPARFLARRSTGGKVPGLFVREQSPGRWEVLLTGAGRLKPGEELALIGGIWRMTWHRHIDRGLCEVEVSPADPVETVLASIGSMPLPPYIRRVGAADSETDALDREQYQTVYAAEAGSVAAPTAGLHFTHELLGSLENLGVSIAQVLLHVGLGTFQPVEVADLGDHPMHREWYTMPGESADRIARARSSGHRVLAVGTTAVRVLETCAASVGSAATNTVERSGWTDILIYPPYKFGAVDALVTNFHLPGSTLLALVMAFAGREAILSAYAEAIRERYRFFSYGDAMLLL